MKWAVTGVVLAALVASSAGASVGAVRAGEYIELCGPAGCARTTDVAGYAQLQAFMLEPDPRRPQGFPPPVQPYYQLKATGLKYPTVFVGSGQMGERFSAQNRTWVDLGPITLQALAKVRKQVRPFAAPLPSSVVVNNVKVRRRPIYRHVFDAFPKAQNVTQSRKPWIGVAVKWPRSAPWPALSFSLRRGTRVVLRPDFAVTVSKALAARILQDAPVKKKR